MLHTRGVVSVSDWILISPQVNFNEPLSFLQRINEDLIYHSVLEQAYKAKDPWDQICYVAAFASSSYASTVYPTGKPFNPLLGETYECDRRSEMGWRSFCEQVNNMLHLSVARYVLC